MGWGWEERGWLLVGDPTAPFTSGDRPVGWGAWFSAETHTHHTAIYSVTDFAGPFGVISCHSDKTTTGNYFFHSSGAV